MKTKVERSERSSEASVNRSGVRKRATQRLSIEASAPAREFQDNCPAAVMQRKLQELIQDGPRQSRQAERLSGLFGLPTQRAEDEDSLQMMGNPAAVQRDAFEEEEPLQGRFETKQRQPLEEEEELLQGRFEIVQRQGDLEDEELLQGRFHPVTAPVQLEAETGSHVNRTGMPDHLKTGMEQLSGMDLSEVRVHANSSKPAELDALAYAQGNEIHLGPGQEKHLPHELWHVVQQRQGRVLPTLQSNGVAINDDPALEQEADAMGERALSKAHEAKDTKAVNLVPTNGKYTALCRKSAARNIGFVVQRLVRVDDLKVRHTSTTETATSASHRFDMRADLKPGSGDHWDFRQEVRGYWLDNGVEQPLTSSGSGLTITRANWVDDGYTKADDTNAAPLVFETNDNPGGGFQQNVPETYYLQFRAKVLDTNNNKILKEKSGYWIKIHGRHPRKFTQGGFD